MSREWLKYNQLIWKYKLLIVSLRTNKNSKNILFPSCIGNGETCIPFKKHTLNWQNAYNVIPIKPWTPEKISEMFIVSQPIRYEIKTCKLQHGLDTTWHGTTSWLWMEQTVLDEARQACLRAEKLYSLFNFSSRSTVLWIIQVMISGI